MSAFPSAATDAPVEPPDRDLARVVVTRAGALGAPLLHFELGLADRALVHADQTVFAGEPLLERVPDATVVEVAAAPGPRPGPGQAIGPDEVPLPEAATLARFGGHGRVLYATGRGRVRAAVGQHPLTVACPTRGTVVEVTAGRLVLRADATGLPGALAAGEATRGELVLAVDGPAGELPSSAIDVGAAGAILVAGARIDLEALGRARAMGVRGVIVGGLVSRDVRGLRASEMRQRRALHGGPPFAVLVLHGYGKRAIAPSTWAALAALAGREVAISIDPALLLVPTEIPLPEPGRGRVRVCAGPEDGREGSFVRQVGRRRWPGGLEAPGALVRLDAAASDEAPLERVVPLADLELLR